MAPSYSSDPRSQPPPSGSLDPQGTYATHLILDSHADPGTYARLNRPIDQPAYGSLDPQAIYATPTAGVSSASPGIYDSLGPGQGTDLATTAQPSPSTFPEIAPDDLYGLAQLAAVKATRHAAAMPGRAAPAGLEVATADAHAPAAAALWMHELDRLEAEAALSAAAVAGDSNDPTVVRFLVRPKEGHHVLSILVPGEPRFYHDHIVLQPDRLFTVQGKGGASMIGVASKVADTLALSFGATGSEPLLRTVHLCGAEVTVSASVDTTC